MSHLLRCCGWRSFCGTGGLRVDKEEPEPPPPAKVEAPAAETCCMTRPVIPASASVRVPRHAVAQNDRGIR